MKNENNQPHDNERNHRSTAARQGNEQPQDMSNTIKDPDEWTTGDEQMTGAQRSYLKTLSDEAGEELNDNLTKAEASKRIEELQQKTGRGQSS
jgi:hypothetical protein